MQPQQRDPTDLLYLDDSGQKEWAPPGVPYNDGLSRYFVFGGYLIRRRAAGDLAAALKAAKVKWFKTDKVEVKSNWLRLPEECRERYLDPYGLSEEQLRDFVDEFYSAGLAADMALLACVVDKEDMTTRWGDKRWYPPACAYESVVQRAHYDLSPLPGRYFKTVVDDMSGKTIKGREWKENMRRHHEQMKQSGSRLQPGVRLERLVGDLGFVDSAVSPLVQFADLVAYNVFRQFRDHGDDWEDTGLPALPTYDWFARVAHKFRRGGDGRIQGHGVIRFPTNVRVPWTERDGLVVRG